MTDMEVLLFQLKAHAVRPKETQVYEYARRLRKLLNSGMTISDLSAIIDKTPNWIRQQLQLNRLIRKAVNKLNNGDMKVTAAAALASLPDHLQEAFLDDACKMKSEPFIKRCREAKRDYDSFLLNQRADEHDDGYYPYLRPVTTIMEEAETYKNAKEVLTVCNATTPLEAWRACLSWMMRLDPITVDKRKRGVKEGERQRITSYQFRKQQRKMIENLTFDTITGDSNG